MTLSVASFIRNVRSIGRAVAHLDANLDDALSLRDLADVACLSPSHFDRLYRGKIHETPLATVRRLRLLRARRQIETGGVTMTRVAHDAGYGSLAAFTRAFARAFGHAPSQMGCWRPTPRPRVPRLAVMETQRLLGLSYVGRPSEICRMSLQLDGRTAVTGTRRWRKWRVTAADEVLHGDGRSIETQLGIPAVQLKAVPQGAGEIVLPRQIHAVFEIIGPDQDLSLETMHEHIRDVLGSEPVVGRAVWRDVSVPGYTPPSEHRRELWLPVAETASSRQMQPLLPAAFAIDDRRDRALR